MLSKNVKFEVFYYIMTVLAQPNFMKIEFWATILIFNIFAL